MQLWPQLKSPEACTELWWTSSSFLSVALDIFIFLFPWAQQSAGVVPGTPIALSGAVTLPGLLLMGVNLSLLLSLPFTLSQCIWGWLVGLITIWVHCFKGRMWPGLHTISSDNGGKRAGSQAGAAPSLFNWILWFWGHSHPKVSPLSNLPVFSFYH